MKTLNNLHLLVLPSLLVPFDAEPISSAPNCCPSWQFSNCPSCEESPSYLEQLVDSYLQTEATLEPALGALQTPSHYISDSFQPVPLCFNQGLVSTACRCAPREAGAGKPILKDLQTASGSWGAATIQAAGVVLCLVSPWSRGQGGH